MYGWDREGDRGSYLTDGTVARVFMKKIIIIFSKQKKREIYFSPMHPDM
jgi:hypothetical protein